MIMRPLLLLLQLFFFFFVAANSSTATTDDSIVAGAAAAAIELQNHTGISEFRLLNRKRLLECHDPNPYLKLWVELSNDNTNPNQLSDEETVTVHVDGVMLPSSTDWVALISPSHSDVSDCLFNWYKYKETGDFSKLPLLCHYPVKAQYVSSDPNYLSRNNKKCQTKTGKICWLWTYNATLQFHVINIRTEIQFVLFTGGFKTPCILKKSDAFSFSNPNSPLYPHLSSVDSSATSMRVTWVSGDKSPQKLRYGNGIPQTSLVTTFTQNEMCGFANTTPAVSFGWHDPGYVHSAVMTGLRPSTTYNYTHGSDSCGWSNSRTFRTPPAAGSNEVKFLAFGDMGRTPLDKSVEHYNQPGSLSVVQAMEQEVLSGNIDSIFHIGDISYATGFLVEWDYFLQLITPVASRISYMTAIGNHERGSRDEGSNYKNVDSGGECGIPYETYFPMPTSEKDKPWYSIEQGPVHFTVISTEHNWAQNSEQYEWMEKDMGAVDRARTPWLIFMGHRPMYSSTVSSLGSNVDTKFVNVIEPLLLGYKVDLALWGHVHNYERVCPIHANQCKSSPESVKNENGTYTFYNTNYTAPIHVVIGMAGFTLDPSPTTAADWSLVRMSEYGYARLHATREDLKFEYVNTAGYVRDSFRITKTIRK
ncbi:unnamed protein product [Cuscuta epithymum]|uniref:Purple acid phosphatase n=1 Tax=Cuscuta epithymum TaxID=186058 RepID=A0AAV0CTP3_9ASTE|nr:unnamed protein product [Cuscuta epithymum]